jgi:DsbC/DsbD-like thiol-disulfide interchange protein
MLYNECASSRTPVKLGFRGLALLMLIGAFSAPGAATTASPPTDVITELKTYVSRDAVHPGETFKAAVRLKIGSGWHINAHPANDEFLIPTSLEFADAAGSFHVLSIAYPEPRQIRLSFSESDLAVYSESALIGALVRADAALKPGTYELIGTITWQACNDISCLPPESQDLELEIVVAEPGEETHDAHVEVFEGINFETSPIPR